MREPASTRCTLLQSHAELQAFASAWHSLWGADTRATPFQHPAWLLPWWQHFGEPHPDRELRCVLVSDTSAQDTSAQDTSAQDEFSGDHGRQPASRSQALLAFLPVYLYPHPDTGERQLLLLGAGTSDYLDGLFASPSSDARQQYALTALHFLLSHPGWDVLHFAQLRPGSPLLAACEHLGLEKPSQTSASRFEVRSWPAEPTSHLPATRLAELPTKIRRNAMYYRNRAERLGELRLEQATEQASLAAFEELVALHTDRWQAAGQSGVLADPAVLAHHRAALPGLARAGLLRLMVLRLDRQTLGILYSLIDPLREDRSAEGTFDKDAGERFSDASKGDASTRTQYFYLPAFSLAHADLRPGTVLTALAIDQAATEGVTCIDFLRGEETYKGVWHAEQLPTFGISLRQASREVL